MNGSEEKFYIVTIETNVLGIRKDFFYYTSSCYYDKNDVETQVANGIYRLGFCNPAEVNVIVKESSKEECSNLEPVEMAYKPLKKYLKEIIKKVEEEKMRRSGARIGRFSTFCKNLLNIFTNAVEGEDEY